jgi:UDP-N-acetylmuramoyl-tripeptide--D-alanyl-D-alanine ligase
MSSQLKTLKLQDIAQATNGKILSTVSLQAKGISTDTRQPMQGQLFIALRGEAFDAHDFIEQCAEMGAAIVLIDKLTPAVEKIISKVSVVQVEDTLKALQNLAQSERRKSKAKILAITGSNGKTTSKEFTAQVLSEHFRVHYSKGSFNNHWGVPLTLLAEPEGTEISVVEMGMSHHGEITELVRIADPDAVVVTTVGRAHIGYFGSVEEIAKAKAEIYIAARKEAVRIFNMDNSHCEKMWRDFGKQGLRFSSKDETAEVFLQIESMDMRGLSLVGKIGGQSGHQKVQVFGEHNLTNIMTAAALALVSGMPPEKIWRELAKCKTNWGRSQLVQTKKGADILFDGYNANPDSMKALVENIKLIPAQGKKVGVFAQMLEQGSLSAQLHQELGEIVGRAGLDQVWFYGTDAAAFECGLKNSNYSKKSIITNAYEEKVAFEVANVLDQGDIAIVKGSRGMKLERFVQACDPLDFSLKKE